MTEQGKLTRRERETRHILFRNLFVSADMKAWPDRYNPDLHSLRNMWRGATIAALIVHKAQS